MSWMLLQELWPSCKLLSVVNSIMACQKCSLTSHSCGNQLMESAGDHAKMDVLCIRAGHGPDGLVVYLTICLKHTPNPGCCAIRNCPSSSYRLQQFLASIWTARPDRYAIYSTIFHVHGLHVRSHHRVGVDKATIFGRSIHIHQQSIWSWIFLFQSVPIYRGLGQLPRGMLTVYCTFTQREFGLHSVKVTHGARLGYLSRIKPFRKQENRPDR